MSAPAGSFANDPDDRRAGRGAGCIRPGRRCGPLLEDGARRGDPDALFALAVWRLEGRRLPRDLAQSRTLFAHAARAGHGDALAVYIAFTANGTGGPGRPGRRRCGCSAHSPPATPSARQQHDLIDAMALDQAGAPAIAPASTRLSRSPDVVSFPALFTAAECAYLAQLAEPVLERATVVDPRSGRLIHDPVRESDHAAFPLALENPAIRALNRRIAAASGTDVQAGEPLQIISYRPGQQYRAHSDALGGTDNQRVFTMLVYLADGYAGGETRFVPGGPTGRGRLGEGLLFRNVDAAGRADPAARHAGLPVTAGRKLIASRWIRARPIDLGDRPQRR